LKSDETAEPLVSLLLDHLCRIQDMQVQDPSFPKRSKYLPPTF